MSDDVKAGTGANILPFITYRVVYKMLSEAVGKIIMVTSEVQATSYEVGSSGDLTFIIAGQGRYLRIWTLPHGGWLTVEAIPPGQPEKTLVTP